MGDALFAQREKNIYILNTLVTSYQSHRTTAVTIAGYGL